CFGALAKFVGDYLAKGALVYLEGQIRGGVAQGIGGAFYEKLIYDENGQLLTQTFMDYLLPSLSEVPAVEIGHVETPSPLNPLGVKGAGEAGVIPVPAVIASAIEDALGVRITEMPLSHTRLLELIRINPVSAAAATASGQRG
ncbi:MAG: molybdopterin-dependent oxidoreductase, partial [Gemmatimonadetes bacterium]|nr:molybdopterin-dependent oxidoreductase [Gemmatimonadota bacterium]